MARAKPIDGLDPTASARSAMPKIFRTRINELWSWARYLKSPGNVQELHDMRIAAKRLRYCFEFFEPFFIGSVYHMLRSFKKLQDYLGEIHDCDAWVGYLRRDLGAVLRGLNEDRKALRQYKGAEPGLEAAARDLSKELADGPAQGLLMLMRNVTKRRGRLYGELLEYWNGLEARGFKKELLAAVAKAAKSGAK